MKKTITNDYITYIMAVLTVSCLSKRTEAVFGQYDFPFLHPSIATLSYQIIFALHR